MCKVVTQNIFPEHLAWADFGKVVGLHNIYYFFSIYLTLVIKIYK